MAGLTSALIGGIGSLTSGVSSVAGGIAQSQAAKGQAEYSSRMADLNAQIADFQAEDAIQRGNREANSVRRQASEALGEQKVNLAAQGIDIGVGSAAQTQQDTLLLGEHDAMTVQNNATREAFGFKVQAADYRAKGKFALLAGENESRNSLLTGGLNAGGHLFSAAKSFNEAFPSTGTTETKSTRTDIAYNSKRPYLTRGV